MLELYSTLHAMMIGERMLTLFCWLFDGQPLETLHLPLRQAATIHRMPCALPKTLEATAAWERVSHWAGPNVNSKIKVQGCEQSMTSYSARYQTTVATLGGIVLPPSVATVAISCLPLSALYLRSWMKQVEIRTRRARRDIGHSLMDGRFSGRGYRGCGAWDEGDTLQGRTSAPRGWFRRDVWLAKVNYCVAMTTVEHCWLLLLDWKDETRIVNDR